MAEKTGKRKVDHIRICLDQKAQAKNVTAGFEDIQLVHRALPEINKSKITLAYRFWWFKGHFISEKRIFRI